MDLDALHDALRPQARGNSITYPSVERCVLASGGTMKEFMDAFLDGRLEEWLESEVRQIFDRESIVLARLERLVQRLERLMERMDAV